MVEKLFDKKIQICQSDGGKEYDNIHLLTHFQRHGIVIQKSCPHTPEQ